MPNLKNLQKSKSQRGKFAESVAEEGLQKRGFRIVDRNYRSRWGEIDIIATYKDTLVFVEVKARWGRQFGLPQESVTSSKLENIVQTGQYYKKLHPNLPEQQRILVYAIEFSENKITSQKLIWADE